MTNGLKNGATNGLKNGATNGLKNGLTNGIKNELKNGEIPVRNVLRAKCGINPEEKDPLYE